MPVFLPFRGLRYRSLTDVSHVAAPPYDVVHDDERAALAARDPKNAVQLILPEPGRHGDGYATAAALLHEWRSDGTLAPDAVPGFYGYRMTFTDPAGHRRVTHGVVGALGLPVDGPGTGDILPHERTISRHRSDRLSLLESTRTNLDPIWGLTPAPGFGTLAGEPGPDRQWAVDDAGVEHEAWEITDADRVTAIRDAVGSAPLVLADGHHRFETACAYRAAHGDHSGEDAIMALIVELAEDELWVAPIHRMVRGAPHARARLDTAFTLAPIGSATPETITALEAAMADAGALGLVDREGVALLHPRPEVVTEALEAEPPEVRDVDAALFEAVVAPRLDGAQIEFRHDAHALADAVARGDADAVVLLRPVSVAQIRAASYAGVRMPQKTSFFAPKPRTGLVFRALDD
ncbi:MAG: DUF1015 family protein [Actinomycetota bacterium]